MRVTVKAGPHTYKNCPMTAPVLAHDLQLGEASLVDESGHRIPCQLFVERGETVVAWIEEMLRQGETKVYRFETSPAGAKSRVDISEVAECLEVKIGGKLFTRYNYSPQYPRPFLYPFTSHDGAQVTRSFPMREDVPDEDHDHKHHRSVWIAYGEVNGTDNWCENPGHGWIRHQKFDEVTGGPVFGRIRSTNLWTSSEGARDMTDVREFTFYNVGKERLMDVCVSLRATDGEVHLGETKEGGIISVRVASSMDGTKGGTIINSYGARTEAENWGRPAQWCDYYGPVGSKTYGITIMDHHSSFRFPTRWHVRDYGMFTANPFALKYFEPTRGWNGDYTINQGEQIDFRYRILVHEDDTEKAGVADKYFCFVAPPSVSVNV